MSARRVAAFAALCVAAALAIACLVSAGGAARGRLAVGMAIAFDSTHSRSLRSTNHSEAAANTTAAAHSTQSGKVPATGSLSSNGTQSGGAPAAEAHHDNGTTSTGTQLLPNVTGLQRMGMHSGRCLCIFDVDRTLTGKQWFPSACPGNRRINGVWDPAYGGGILALSELGQHVRQTFCGSCLLGIVSAGSAGGSHMKQVIHRQLVGLRSVANKWSGPNPVTAPLVGWCRDSHKPACTRGVMDWYNREYGFHMHPRDVYFFDDKRNNVKAVAGAGFNAHQVSCAHRRRRRKYSHGLCGGRLSEVRRQHGMTLC